MTIAFWLRPEKRRKQKSHKLRPGVNSPGSFLPGIEPEQLLVFYFCSFDFRLALALNIKIDVHPENRAVEREQVFPSLDYMKTQVDGLFSF